MSFAEPWMESPGSWINAQVVTLFKTILSPLHILPRYSVVLVVCSAAGKQGTRICGDW